MAESKQKTPTGLESAACSAGLLQPVVELVDVTASTSTVITDMKRPTAPATRRRIVSAKNSDDEGDSDASTTSVMSVSSERRARKRGRPPTTGEYVGLAEAKKLLVEQHMKALEIEAERMVLDPSAVPLPSRSSKGLPTDDAVAEEMRQEPTGSLGSQILEAMLSVERVAAFSQNLKGTSVRALRVAAQRARLASAELAKRTGGDGGRTRLEDENKELRSQVESLQGEVRRLSERIDLLVKASASTIDDETSRQDAPQDVMETEAVQARFAVEDTPRDISAAPAHTTAPIREPPLEDMLLQRIGELVDKKLAEFRTELFPGRAVRPPLGVKPAAKTPANAARKEEERPGDELVPQGQKKNKKKVKSVKPAATPARAGQATGRETSQSKATTAPPTTEQGDGEWAKVVGKKAKKTASKQEQTGRTTAAPAATKTAGPQSKKPAEKPVPEGAPKKKKSRAPRAPKSAAVTLTVPEGNTTSYADAMRTVKQRVNLTEIGVGEVRPKRALTGGLILEIPGPEGVQKARALASRMADALVGTGVKVAQPTKMAELRVRGLDDSVTPDEVAAALVSVGGCEVGDVKTGEIRRSPTGLGTLWLRCPAAAARKVVLAGRLMVGWVSAKVETLEARPLQCHRCLEAGHVRQKCTNTVDRSALCYNCGAPGHMAGQCPAKSPRCPVCADMGAPADHRMGSKKCSPPKKKNRSAGAQGPAATASTTATKSSGTKETTEPAGDAKRPAPSSNGLEEAMELS